MPLQIGFGRVAVSMRRGILRFALRPIWSLTKSRHRTAEEISLFHPTALRMAETNPAFTLGREDVYDLSPQSFNAVRALNLIKGAHSKEDRARILHSIAASIEDD